MGGEQPTPARNCASPTSTVTAASCLSPTCPTRTWPYLEALYRGRAGWNAPSAT
ncbi:hypothetical protein I552_2075 [Mycobacterium xenopi 3993]|nr:hypothetical protein I552_2075 [Mycobacterium xenopi 3993]